MIEVHTCTTGKGEVVELWVSGHAGFADEGEDIVCAGVSALVETALIGLRKVARQKPLESERKKGHVWIRVEPGDPQAWEKAQAILQTTLLGLKDIQKDYPAFIRISEGD